MSFRCEHCGFSNCELQSGSKIQDRGVTFKVKIKEKEDLNLQIVKSDSASLSVPEIELEVPPESQKGGRDVFTPIIFRAFFYSFKT